MFTLAHSTNKQGESRPWFRYDCTTMVYGPSTSTEREDEGRPLLADRSSGEWLTEERSSGERLTDERSSGERLTEERSSGERLSVERSSGERLRVERSSGERLRVERSSGERLTDGLVAAERSMVGFAEGLVTMVGLFVLRTQDQQLSFSTAILALQRLRLTWHRSLELQPHAFLGPF